MWIFSENNLVLAHNLLTQEFQAFQENITDIQTSISCIDEMLILSERAD